MSWKWVFNKKTKDSVFLTTIVTGFEGWIDDAFKAQVFLILFFNIYLIKNLDSLIVFIAFDKIFTDFENNSSYIRSLYLLFFSKVVLFYFF